LQPTWPLFWACAANFLQQTFQIPGISIFLEVSIVALASLSQLHVSPCQGCLQDSDPATQPLVFQAFLWNLSGSLHNFPWGSMTHKSCILLAFKISILGMMPRFAMDTSCTWVCLNHGDTVRAEGKGGYLWVVSVPSSWWTEQRFGQNAQKQQVKWRFTESGNTLQQIRVDLREETQGPDSLSGL
jgi:hypothetical protein